MKTVVIYGTEHKGSTYNIVKLFLKNLDVTDVNLKEFYLPKDLPDYCCGCVNCIKKGEEYCPHYKKTAPIIDAMETADLIILASPVYVMRVTGQMKTFLDHFAFQFMIHRPNKAMFSKTALVITTAAGAGMKPAIKDITTSLTYWGVGKIFTYGKAVKAADWQGVEDSRKKQIKQEVAVLSEKILKSIGHITPNLKVRALFYVMRFVQKKHSFMPTDRKYWEKQGWLGKKRPF